VYQTKIVPAIWDDSYKYYDYERQPITNKELTTWRSQGYTHNTVTGKMYSSKNIMPPWVYDISKYIHLNDCGYTFYRMDTLDIMPTHVDKYETYCKVFDVDYKDVIRAVIFLEDWKPGHQFEINGKSYNNWQAGFCCMWHDEPHSAANIGVEPRYTLQITGTSI
jgi:hypothetical protein